MIETERLIMRKLTPDDADALVRMYSKGRNYFKYTRIPYPYTRKSAADFIRSVIRSYRTREKFYLCIIEKKSNTLIGSIALNRINRADSNAEIGYSIAKSHSNQGYVTEAAKAFIDYAFRKMKLHRIEINCAVQNAPSRRVIKKLGAKSEGISRDIVFSRNRYLDSYRHSILKKEWKKKISYKIRR